MIPTPIMLIHIWTRLLIGAVKYIANYLHASDLSMSIATMEAD